MDIRPYIAFDLETTGLNRENSHILEIAGILDDGIKPIEELDTFHAILKWERFDWAEPYALSMNPELIQIIAGRKPHDALMAPATALAKFTEFVMVAGRLAYDYDKNKGWDRPSQKIYLAGKNVASFDLPILENNFKMISDINIVWKIIAPFIHYKILDVGSMYYDGAIPSLGDINKLTGRDGEVKHRAIDDAMDIVYAVRKHAGKL